MKRILLAAAALLAAPVLAHAAPYLPIEGSPNSIQTQILRGALNLDDVDVEGAARFSPEGDADVIGGAFTYWDGGPLDGERYEARYQKAWRPFEGQRSRALVDVPINAITNEGHTEWTGALSAGLEMAVSDNWSITPRVAVGVAEDDSWFGGGGEVYIATLGSRYRFPQVGRGDLVMGNLIGVSHSDDDYGGTDDIIFRNGLAYQFPLKTQLFGRSASARFSVTHTALEGDPTFIDSYFEFAASLGVRNREANLRNRFELLRIGVIYTRADDYDSGTVTFGYRF